MPHSSLVMILSADTNCDIGIQLQHGSSDVGCQGHIVTHSSLMELEYTQIKVMLFNLLLTLSHNTLFTIHVVVCRTGTDFLWGRVGAIYLYIRLRGFTQLQPSETLHLPFTMS